MRKFVSIVVPFYNEEGNVEELASRIHQEMHLSGYPYEMIFVNDGSSDDTWLKMQLAAVKYDHLVAIDLAGNYGQTIALRAGFERAKGEIIVAMDGDLQHDPKYIPEFIRYIEKGYDMVGGAKASRPDGWLKSSLSHLAHTIICRLTKVKLQYFGATFKVFRSYLLKNSNMLGDSHRYLGALVARKGVRYIELPIDINERHSGSSKYKWNKVFFVILDLIFLKFIVSYLARPFRFFGVIGLAAFLSGCLVSVYFILGSVFFDFNIKEDFLAEFLFALTLVITGAVFVSFGIIAEIGILNYHSRNSVSPYNVREAFQKEQNEISEEEKNYY